jgi:hypothetical protein
VSVLNRRTTLAAILVAASAGGLAGQSLTAARGLGYPIVPTDARSEALGGLGIGLMGLAVPLTNPAASAGVDRRGVVVTAAATNRRSTLGDVTGRTGATRFPLIRILFPVGGVVLSGGYGTFLDQSWSVIREGSESTGSGSFSYRDVVESRGGIGQAYLGAAAPIGNRLALGVAVGRYTGSQDVNISRVFDTTSIGLLQPYSETRRFRYGGPMAQIGFRWDPLDIMRVGGSVTWSGTLEADSLNGPVPSQDFDLPIQVAGGASAYLSPGLLAAVSGRWSGWSVTDPTGGLADPDADLTGRDTWELGGGLELDNPQSRAIRTFPVRLGFQYRQLPFTFVSDAPREWLASLGLGMRMGTNVETPLARVDLTIQRGARTANGSASIPALNEVVWRFALSVSLFGT